MLSRGPPGVGLNGDHKRVWCSHRNPCTADPMFHEGLELRIEPGERIEDGSGNEIVPGRKTEIAMNEEEDKKDRSSEEMCRLEEFVIPVALVASTG